MEQLAEPSDLIAQQSLDFCKRRVLEGALGGGERV